uniref:protein-serine/threonine phosphatase n=1 Tax=Zea mays TaxID=4577 RepID=A0A804MIL1_MAIZE
MDPYGSGRDVWDTGTKETAHHLARRRRGVSSGRVFSTSYPSRRLDVVQSGCTALSIVKHGDLMVVANVDDSRVVLGIATYDDAITPSSSSST